MSKEQEINLTKLIERSYSEERCRAYLEGLRWPEGEILSSLRLGQNLPHKDARAARLRLMPLPVFRNRWHHFPW